MPILCRIVGHRRSRGLAAFNISNDRWESFCIRCHTRLARNHRGVWRPPIGSGQVRSKPQQRAADGAQRESSETR
jgi:hypothetical protein